MLQTAHDCTRTSLHLPRASSHTASPACLLQRSRRQRKGKIEAKVKVQSAIIDEVTGKTAATSVSQFETLMVNGLGIFFLVVIFEGLVLASSVSYLSTSLLGAAVTRFSMLQPHPTCSPALQGFMPDDFDQFVREAVYPSYSWTVLGFLCASSFYGLWKTGKLPGQAGPPPGSGSL